MGTRSKRADRCARCRMHTAQCICSLLPQLDLQTKVIVVMHHREWKKPTASAALFAECVPSAEVRLRGERDRPFDDQGIIDDERRTLLLYPADDARLLTTAVVSEDTRPITLVVPDGSWRQAAKATQREPVLAALPRITLPDMGPTRYRLRHEPKAGGLGTFEAIARALRIIEGEPTYQALNEVFEEMVSRTLATRGSGNYTEG